MSAGYFDAERTFSLVCSSKVAGVKPPEHRFKAHPGTAIAVLPRSVGTFTKSPSPIPLPEERVTPLHRIFSNRSGSLAPPNGLNGTVGLYWFVGLRGLSGRNRLVGLNGLSGMYPIVAPFPSAWPFPPHPLSRHEVDAEADQAYRFSHTLTSRFFGLLPSTHL